MGFAAVPALSHNATPHFNSPTNTPPLQKSSWGRRGLQLPNPLGSTFNFLGTASAALARSISNRTAAIVVATGYVFSQIPPATSLTPTFSEAINTTAGLLAEYTEVAAINCSHWADTYNFCSLNRNGELFKNCCKPHPHTLKVALPFVLSLIAIGSAILYKSGVMQRDNSPPFKPLPQEHLNQLINNLHDGGLISTNAKNDFTESDNHDIQCALRALTIKRCHPEDDRAAVIDKLRSYCKDQPVNQHIIQCSVIQCALDTLEEINDADHDSNGVPPEAIEMQKPSSSQQSGHRYSALTSKPVA
ncbi:hypothetical protein [Endozoicomonas sp.]|uniref:hypothetical protein n=1 Tax=Endozoicomonas sp. TaxID=1892382 RepID=UPI00288467BB|nr:hypothetical protein [Endozoicomonas sp.]